MTALQTAERIAGAGHTLLFLTVALLVAAAAIRFWPAVSGRKSHNTLSRDGGKERPSAHEGSPAAHPGVVWGYRLHFAGWLFATASMLLLVWLFISDSFAFTYVAGRSNRAMETVYKVTALWAGQEGSLILWLWIQTGYGLIVSHRALRGRALDRYASAALALIASFFALLVAFVVDPFAVASSVPADGAGMNPILQSYWMTAHPVMLYLGYVGLSVPFAYGVASLFSSSEEWIRSTRRWTLVAWTFLSIGILFGARWAYEELGWGGYWGWDPVENASFMPWLVATAFIHSGLIQEKRGMLKRWNHLLILCTYLLTIFGTFVTRSGILSSVHAFVESDISPWFIGYLGLVSALFLYGLINRWPELKDDHSLVSPLSKESSFLANNVVLLATCFAIFWGTVFPLVASVFGRQVTVGTPYFNRVTGPLFWILTLLMGLGPLLGWRRASAAQMKRHFTGPALNAFFMVIWLLVVGLRELPTLLALPAAVFVLTTILMEFAKGASVRSHSRGEPFWLALPRMMNRSPGRYGGYLVHLGILFIVVGVTVSQVYQQQENVALSVGETVTVGPYNVTLHDIERVQQGNVPAVHAKLLVEGSGGPLGYVQPSKRFYPGSSGASGPTTEVAVFGSVRGDLYAVLAGWEPFGTFVGFKLFFTPLVWLIWAGGAIVVWGGVFSFWPRDRQALVASERALSSLAELEYDYQMGKVDEAEYQALYAEYSPKAANHLEKEARAAEGIRRELAERLRRTDKDVDAPGSSVLGIILIAGLTACVWVGTTGISHAADSSAVAPNARPPMGVEVAVPSETMVLKVDGVRLLVLDFVSVKNVVDTPVDEVRLPLAEGARGISLAPEGLTVSDTNEAVDTKPLAPDEERRYTLRYEVTVLSWPYGFQRRIRYPTQQLSLLSSPGELAVGGLDVQAAGSRQVAGQELRAVESRWLAPGQVWQTILTPGPSATSVVGWNPSFEGLPQLAEADRFPGDWLLHRMAKLPPVAWLALLLVISVASGRWIGDRIGKRFGGGLANGFGDEERTGGERAGLQAGADTAEGREGLESLMRSIARLDVAYAEGALGRRVYRRRRKSLMNTLESRSRAVGLRANDVSEMLTDT